MTFFPYFSGASSCLASASHPCSNLFSPFPGCHSLPRISISPRKRLIPSPSGVHFLFSGRRLTSAMTYFPYFSDASPCLACTSHLWHSSLFPISGVPDPASYAHLTTKTSPSPAFRGAPLCHTDLWHLSLRNYFCGAENAWNFPRRR